jgi:protein required for attachment to host cells
LFEQERAGARLTELTQESLPEPELSEFADRPGRSHERHGQSRHAKEPHTDLRTQGQEKYAQALAQFLATAVHGDRFGQLVVAAPPSLLGHVRKQLPGVVEERLAGTLDKDLMSQKVRALEQHLTDFTHFAPPELP